MPSSLGGLSQDTYFPSIALWLGRVLPSRTLRQI